MTEGNIEFVRVVISWLVTLPAVALVIRRDERRLTGVALERAWPPQSRDAAIFGLWNLGALALCLCVMVHFARTRRSTQGWLIGLSWVVAILVVDAAAQVGATSAIEWLGV